MKIYRLKGGLGNQLFIIAAALTTQRFERVCFDARPTYRTDRKPTLELLEFLNFTYFHKGIVAQFFRILDKLRFTNKLSVYQDEYFQSPDTLLRLSDIDKDRLSTFLNLLPLKPQAECVVHIRLGDFVNQMPDEVLAPKYYIEEIERLPDTLDISIISDADAEELIRNGYSSLLQRPNVSISSITSMNEHFKAIAAASHVIGSNSTFCLWATYLGHYILPKKHIKLGPTFKNFECCFYD